jgi:hypothetical protein
VSSICSSISSSLSSSLGLSLSSSLGSYLGSSRSSSSTTQDAYPRNRPTSPKRKRNDNEDDEDISCSSDLSSDTETGSESESNLSHQNLREKDELTNDHYSHHLRTQAGTVPRLRLESRFRENKPASVPVIKPELATQKAAFLSQLALCGPTTTLLAQGVREVTDYLSLTQSKAERTEHLGSTLQRHGNVLQKRKRVRHIAAMNNTQRPTWHANLSPSTSTAVSTRITSSSTTTSPRHHIGRGEGRIHQVQSPLSFLKTKARFLRYKLSTQQNVEALRGELLSFLEELQKSEIGAPQLSSSSRSLSSPLSPFVHTNTSPPSPPAELHLAEVSLQSPASRSPFLPTIQSMRSRERQASSVDLSNVPLNVQQRVRAILMEDLSAIPSDNLQGYVQRVQEGDNNP